MQEAEHAEMLKARQDSGKSASTSAPCAADEAGVAEDSIFAGIDLDGKLSGNLAICASPLCTVVICKMLQQDLHRLGCRPLQFPCSVSVIVAVVALSVTKPVAASHYLGMCRRSCAQHSPE